MGSQRSYTVAENWGGQINFMFPLDRRGLAQCRRIAARQEEKMRLDYELVRVLKCAELQRKGFMLAEETRVYDMCSDVVPIVEYQAKKKAAVKQYLKKNVLLKIRNSHGKNRSTNVQLNPLIKHEHIK